jgi:putative acetyltransferase
VTRPGRSVSIRPASAQDVTRLARLWHDAWHDAHAAHVPEALRARRDPGYFRNSMAGLWGAVRLAQSGSAILGFHLTRPPVLELLFVARSARRQGVGRALLEDADLLLTAARTQVAELECLAANTPARRFYERFGWQEAGAETQEIPTADGPVRLEAVTYRWPAAERRAPR